MCLGGSEPDGLASLVLTRTVSPVSPRTGDDDDPDAWMDRFALLVGLVMFLILAGLMVVLAYN